MEEEHQPKLGGNGDYQGRLPGGRTLDPGWDGLWCQGRLPGGEDTRARVINDMWGLNWQRRRGSSRRWEQYRPRAGGEEQHRI